MVDGGQIFAEREALLVDNNPVFLRWLREYQIVLENGKSLHETQVSSDAANLSASEIAAFNGTAVRIDPVEIPMNMVHSQGQRSLLSRRPSEWCILGSVHILSEDETS